MTFTGFSNLNIRFVMYSSYTEFLNLSEKGTHPKFPLSSISTPPFCCFSDLPIFRQHYPQSAIHAKQFPRLLPSPTLNSFTMSSWFNFLGLSQIHLYLSNPTAVAWDYTLCISHLANHTASMPLPSFSPFSTLFQHGFFLFNEYSIIPFCLKLFDGYLNTF